MERSGCALIRTPSAAFERLDWLEQTTGEPASAPRSGRTTVALSPAFAARYPAGANRLLEAGAVCTGDAQTLLGCAAGLSACALGVAETGSLLLAGAEPAERLTWLLPPLAILVVEADDVVESLDDAMAWLASHPDCAAATLVTGPSKTSDVERVLTIGVQGPRAVSVVLIDEESQ